MTTTMKRKMNVPISVDIPFSTRWIDGFIALKCATDLLALYPNAKEITESMAVFGALRKFKPDYPAILYDPTVICLCPGDGRQPRTAALAAFRSCWSVVSIDPIATQCFRADRLRYEPHLVEDIPDMERAGRTVVVLSTHSHASLNNLVRKIIRPKALLVVALECCVPMAIDGVSRPRRIQSRKHHQTMATTRQQGAGASR